MAHLPEEVWKNNEGCLELQITRGLGRLGYLVLRTLDRIRNGSGLDISGEDCKFQDDFDHIAVYLDGLSQLGIWPSLGPFKVLPVSKAVKLIMELPDVCRDPYYGEDPNMFGGWGYPPELETLCNRADLVLQSIKGFTWPKTSSGCEEDDDGVIPLSMDDGW
ncbi:9b00fc90-d153-44c0-99dd-bd8c552ca883 [Thermothielavioides terrestris]|uniref:9b00fc90-d153-44c0-99dd-bd8c552ca883 n=1 Tax=Thermothielavioides terrestris TaxID=2587410 RepID=A0A3S4AQE2_9PEZI|nr:9b00fc90-d153-44c0-99dd-bd8c552ca883 [Thermothielavioides terrestris]